MIDNYADTLPAKPNCVNRVGTRDYDIKRLGLEARADWRFAEDGAFVATWGRNQSSGVELTGLGAGQTQDWVYEFFQGRVSHNRFFAQAYLNTSNSGESYLINNGVPLVDRSKLWVTQVQHGIDMGMAIKTRIWLRLFATRPETEITFWSYENRDHMDEWGVYLQSKTALTDKIDFVLAARVDDHSILPKEYSPRGLLCDAAARGSHFD